jgi:1-acyl-sn-glycerol-3-phosphate acyltransferase
MDRKDFWNILKTRHGYQSPPRPFRPPWWLASPAYYAGVIEVVFRHGRVARRGDYTRFLWATGALEIIRVVEAIGGRVEIGGLSGVAGHPEPVVFVANHMSMIDAFFLPGVLLPFRDITFVVKRSLLNYPYFGAVMRAVRPVAVDRENPRDDLRKVLGQGEGHLAEGRSVVVFPQATRNPVFDRSVFNSLGVKLARRAGVMVVPVALKTDFQDHGRVFKDVGRIDPRKTIHIQFGDPMPVEGGGQVTHERVANFIADHLRRWGGQVRA